MKYASFTVAIRGEDPVSRETALYEMAMLAYGQRDWYQPCRSVPGRAMPVFLHNGTSEDFDRVRSGILLLKGAGNPRDAVQIKEKSPDAERAAVFLDYVLRVSTVENYNRSCCQVLLMAHATLKALNPEGDAAAILLLDGLVQDWYGIFEPALTSEDRAAQARKHTQNFHWLSGGWRKLWETP